MNKLIKASAAVERNDDFVSYNRKLKFMKNYNWNFGFEEEDGLTILEAKRITRAIKRNVKSYLKDGEMDTLDIECMEDNPLEIDMFISSEHVFEIIKDKTIAVKFCETFGIVIDKLALIECGLIEDEKAKKLNDETTKNE